MMNRVFLIGRLTAAPELRYTNNATPVASFTLAVDSGFGEYKRTDFINIVVWGKIGENSAKYLAKGKLAAVDGRLQIRSYEKNGEKKWVTEVIAESVIFLSPADKKDSAAEDVPELSEGVPGYDPNDLPF